MKACKILLIIMTLAGTFYQSTAQPDLKNREQLSEMTVYPDIKREDTYYYAPLGLKLATDAEGKPAFKFLLMRYTGTRLRGDQGSFRFKSLLKMKIVNQSPSLTALSTVKERLSAKKGLKVVELKPLPIQDLRALLVYNTLEDNQQDTTLHVLEKGFFETVSGQQGKGTYWKERNFILRLDDHTAQAFWEGFNKKQTLLSVGYAFFTGGRHLSPSTPEFSGSPRLVDEMKQRFASQPDSLAREDTLGMAIVQAGAFAVRVDTEKWPDLLEKVDINEQIPPEYAALEVYCYDFNNELRPDLYLKRLDIEATGVNDKPVRQSYTFTSTRPDIYAATLSFPYAIRLDRPYQYRTMEINHRGEISQSGWEVRENWYEVLNISTQNKSAKDSQEISLK